MPRKRNVRKLPLRPALPRRCIVWFPAFPIEAPIEAFRRQHDPLANALPAHVTLVFPFATNLTSVQLASHVKRIVGNWPPLPVTFRDIESIVDEFVVLMVRERADALVALHDKLYRGVLRSHLRSEIPYVPHVTLGRVRSHPVGASFSSLFENAALQIRGEWRAILRELAVVTMHPDGTINVDQTIPLNFA